MGCDIHMFVEKSTEDGWEAVVEPPGWDEWVEQHGYERDHEWYIGRHYGLFARLAGVRGDAEPIAAPRGVPADISLPVADHLHRWNGDAHTPSWLSVDELSAHDWTHYGFQPFVDAVADLGAARVVFWFDN